MFNELKYTFGNYLAFSRESQLALVEAYHHALSPLPLLGLLLGIALFVLFLTNRVSTTRWLRSSLILTGLGWLLIGAIWQMRYLAQLDWSAAPIGWAMIVQGGLMIVCAIGMSNNIVVHPGVVGRVALLTAALGGFGLAMAQWVSGLPFSQLDRFGVDAASTALMNTAVVMLLPPKYFWLLAIPWLWSVRQFTVSWPLDDGIDMSIMPWVTLCILIAALPRGAGVE